MLQKVYFAPDRTVSQREEHRKLVSELKTRAASDPDQVHFIKYGKVCSGDKIRNVNYLCDSVEWVCFPCLNLPNVYRPFLHL